jgi:hypothetical protein
MELGNVDELQTHFLLNGVWLEQLINGFLANPEGSRAHAKGVFLVEHTLVDILDLICLKDS